MEVHVVVSGAPDVKLEVSATRLKEARTVLSPKVGTTVYTLNQQMVSDYGAGEETPMNEVLLRLPWVAQDSKASGSLHVRDEHANVQYRINGIQLPEGISGFGQSVDSRFADGIDFVTGALPAQYGLRTAGIVDIETKDGSFIKLGGSVGFFGGGHDTLQPSVEVVGSKDALSYYATATYLSSAQGIENPLPTRDAIHDHTEQTRGFGYLSYLVNDDTRVGPMAQGVEFSTTYSSDARILTFHASPNCSTSKRDQPMKLTPLKPFAAAAMLAIALLPSASVADATDTPMSGSNVVRATLKNGLRVVIVHDALAPVVATQVTYLAGGYETPRGYPGTAHALEHMMFRGSRGLTGAQLNELSGKMGGDNNAFTTNDATQYTFLAPAVYLDALMRIEASRMRGANLSEQDWRLERGAIEQEVSSDISNPAFLAFEDAERILYHGTGYAEDPLGTRPSFDRTTSKALRAFYDDWYQPGNAIVVIVGDVDPETTLVQVKALFEAIPSKPIPPRKPLVVQPMKSQTLTRTTPSGEGSLQFAYRMPGMMSNDYAAAQVLMDALGNARSELSELAARGKVLNATAELEPFSHAGIGLIQVGFPKGGSGAKARADLDEVVASLLRNGVPPGLVGAAKRAELAQFEFRKNSPVSLASEWSDALAWQGLDSPDAAEKALEKVTVEDVNRVAREYLRPDARVTIVLVPSANGKVPPDSSGFGGSESFTGDDKLDVPLPDWAEKALGKLELPRWTLDPARMELSNGMTLIVQPEHVSKTVTVVGHIDRNAGLQEPKGQEGVGRLLGSLFDYGTMTLDRAEFHKALDDIAATASGGGDFELAVPSADFDRGMELLAEDELRPALPDQAFGVQRQTLAHVLEGERQTPRYKLLRALKRGLLPAGDPDLREATPDSVKSLALEDVRKLFESTYRPDLTTLVVVGDVTPGQAKATVEKYFGAWQAQGSKPNVVPPKVPVNPPSTTFVPNGYASQDKVVMAQMVDIDLDDGDRYALQLGNDVLGGNGFASRLMLEIRVKHGYAYGAGSGLDVDRSRSTFYLEYGSDADKVARVDSLALGVVKAMRQKPVADSEVNNARQYQIRSIPLDVSSVDRIARSLLMWSYKGEPLDQPIVAAKHYLALNAVQVRDAFARHLHPDHFVKIVEGPPVH